METIASPSKECPSASDEPITLAGAVRRLIELDDETARRGFIEQCLHVCDADELLPLLKDESERHLNSTPQVAKRLAEALIFASELIERPDYRALGVMAVGDVCRVLGHFEESVAAMDEAGDLFLALGNEVGWARTRNGWLRSSHHVGRGGDALPVADRACAILTKNHMWLRAANLTYNTAFVCSELGRYDEALAHYNRAEEMYLSLGEPAELDAAHMKFNKAVLLTQLGDFQTSLSLYEEVRQVFLRYGQTSSVLRQGEHVAIVNAAQGHYTRALQIREGQFRTRESEACSDGIFVHTQFICEEVGAQFGCQRTLHRFDARHGMPVSIERSMKISPRFRNSAEDVLTLVREPRHIFLPTHRQRGFGERHRYRAVTQRE